MNRVTKTDAQWHKELTEEQYRVLRMKGTEPPFSGTYAHTKGGGTYRCVACGNELFSSDTKYDSGSGWPSFWDVIDEGKVELHDDTSMGMVRTEIVCVQCGSHLGHLFDDGPQDKTGKRYCINSVALDLKPKKEED
ncbi:peptide-methionine (R)-S-oxide reductase MsrB [Patescibacteria group bacterium]|nr:peptide-methionine (R)-S-oxide reductase MsrB [Patescibacteria group bacterium]